MGYLGYVFATALRRLLAIGSIRKAMYYGIAVGGVVGITIALVEGHWPLIFVGCGVGSVLGVVLGLIIRAIRIMRGRDQ